MQTIKCGDPHDIDSAIITARAWLKHYLEGGCKFRPMMEAVREMLEGLPIGVQDRILGECANQALAVEEPKLNPKRRPRPAYIDAMTLDTVDLFTANDVAKLEKHGPDCAYTRAAASLKLDRVLNIRPGALKGRYTKLCTERPELRALTPEALAALKSRWHRVTR